MKTKKTRRTISRHTPNMIARSLSGEVPLQQRQRKKEEEKYMKIYKIKKERLYRKIKRIL